MKSQDVVSLPLSAPPQQLQQLRPDESHLVGDLTEFGIATLFALVGPSASSAFAAAGEESLGSAAVDPIEHEEDLDEGMGLLQDTHKEEDKSKLVRTQKAVMSCGHLLNKPTSSLYVAEFRTLCEAVALSAGGQTPALLERIKAFLDPER